MKTELLTEIAHARRLIGIVPRVKQTAEREARPTTITIFDKDGTAGEAFRPKLEAADEQDELDFVLGAMPTKMRKVLPNEDISSFKEHHISRDRDGNAVEVPALYEGLKAHDVVLMSLGGSGDNFAFALSRKGEQIGALVLRVPPFTLKSFREERKLEADDSSVLVELFKANPDAFYPVFVRERKLTWMRECLRSRIDTMKARIACEQRLRQRFIGKIFCNADGLYPEGAIEKDFDALKASDPILSALEKEEAKANSTLEKACEDLEVYSELFVPITGLGPSIGSRLLSSIQDIRRFETKWKLRKFCGVHCMTDGRFPRRRKGELANWNPDSRQALFLLGEQFNRRPDSEWGKKLLANKVYYREKHPTEIIGENGKKKFTKAHIHKRALWKTLGEFIEWLFEAWWDLERKNASADVGERKAA